MRSPFQWSNVSDLRPIEPSDQKIVEVVEDGCDLRFKVTLRGKRVMVYGSMVRGLGSTHPQKRAGQGTRSAKDIDQSARCGPAGRKRLTCLHAVAPATSERDR